MFAVWTAQEAETRATQELARWDAVAQEAEAACWRRQYASAVIQSKCVFRTATAGALGPKRWHVGAFDMVDHLFGCALKAAVTIAGYLYAEL